MTTPSQQVNTDKKPQWQVLLEAMQRGEKLTPAIAYERYNCLSCSQRMGDLKKLGYPVQSQIIEVGNDKRVAEYWLDRKPIQSSLFAVADSPRIVVE